MSVENNLDITDMEIEEELSKNMDNINILEEYLFKETIARDMYKRHLINKNDYDMLINGFPLYIRENPIFKNIPELES